MRPSEEFSKVVRVVRLCSGACGADILDKGFKINGITYFVVFCITVYFIFTVYTIQLKYSENWTVALEAFCMVGSVIQGISKLISAIRYGPKFRSLFEYISAVYAQYEGLGKEYNRALKNSIKRMLKLLKIVAFVYSLGGVTIATVPFIMWAVDGRRLFVMQYFLPGIDANTNLGYLATNGMQMTCFWFGAFGNFAGDLMMLTLFSQTKLLVDIFALKRKELNILIANSESPGIEDKLKDVIQWHQSYSEFIELSDLVTFWINFTEVTMSGVSIVLTLVIVFNGNWPGSYVYICYCFLMLYLYCGMGTQVELSNDRMTEEIYAISWYAMTVPHQKSVRLMLMRSHLAKNISVGGVTELSVNTGLQVTKTVYSVFMLLLKLF